MHSSLLRLYYRFSVLISVFLFMLLSGTLDAAPSAQAGQTTVPLHVTTGKDQGYTIKVLARRDGGTLLIDLESMARALRLSFHQEEGALVLEEALVVPGSSCTVMINNNFAKVVSKDPEHPKRIIQLQSAPSSLQSRIYLPVNQACRLFTVWLDREVGYNYSSGMINAWFGGKHFGESVGMIGLVKGDEPPPVPPLSTPAADGSTVISGIEIEKRANGAIISFTASGHPTESSLLKPDAEGYVYFTLEKASCDVNTLSKIFSGG